MLAEILNFQGAKPILSMGSLSKEIYEAQSKGGGDFDHPGKEG